MAERKAGAANNLGSFIGNGAMQISLRGAGAKRQITQQYERPRLLYCALGQTVGSHETWRKGAHFPERQNSRLPEVAIEPYRM